MIQRPAGSMDPPSTVRVRSHPPPHAAVVRPRLIERIDSPQLAPVTLITAAAGYGKSTVAAQWMAQADHPVAWIALGPEANSLAVCLARFDAAIAALPAADRPPDPEPTLDTLLRRLQAIAEAQGAVSLVLDDFHCITNLDVHRFMDALLAQLPAFVHLLILSRTLPPLALGRLRVLGRVREVTEADLRFTRAEAVEVVSAESNDHLTSSHITRLVEQTDGWIAGLRLALLALDNLGSEQIDAFVTDFAENPWLEDYIVEEVLNTLPHELRDFVLRTASLGSLEPALCAAALGIDRSADLIDEVARRLVFIRRDGRSSAGLSYHALFAECVARIARRQLSTDEFRALHSGAAEWFAQHGRLEQAIEQAVAAEAWDLAQDSVRELCRGLRDRDLTLSLLHWLEKLPESVRLAQPDLAFWHIRALVTTAHEREAARLLRLVQPTWQHSGDPLHRAYALSCQGAAAIHDGDLDLAMQLNYQRLQAFPLDCVVDRLHIWSVICLLESLRGNDEVADAAYRQATHCRAQLPAEQRWWTLYTEFVRTDHHAIRGDLPTAEGLHRHQLAHLPSQLRYAEAHYRQRLAEIYLEWNELERALAETERVIQDLETFPRQYWYPEARLTAARVFRAAGQRQTAADMLRRVLDRDHVHGLTHHLPRAHALQASWWLEDGELRLARAWAGSPAADGPPWATIFGEVSPSATRIQLLVAEGDHAAALALAREVIAAGTPLKRWAELVPLHVWEAVAHLGLGDQPAALDALRSALALGMRGNFVRAFFPAGTDLRPFLAAAQAKLPAAEAAYLASLLAPAGVTDLQDESDVARAHQPPAPAPRSPLSPREREVLALLHNGASNREIAKRLFLTERTVKMHVGNLLAKLGVRNRTAAVTRARELGLVDGSPEA